MAVKYFSENPQFIFKNRRDTTNWLKKVICSYKRVPGDISFIFCTDDQLLEINKTYLKHFYYTDVITFNYNTDDVISGDIYISTDRISENAQNFRVSFQNELYRVMVHGVLHLLGFKDKTKIETKQMRDLEDFHLNEFTLRK